MKNICRQYLTSDIGLLQSSIRENFDRIKGRLFPYQIRHNFNMQVNANIGITQYRSNIIQIKKIFPAHVHVHVHVHVQVYFYVYVRVPVLVSIRYRSLRIYGYRTECPPILMVAFGTFSVTIFVAF